MVPVKTVTAPFPVKEHRLLPGLAQAVNVQVCAPGVVSSRRPKLTAPIFIVL